MQAMYCTNRVFPSIDKNSLKSFTTFKNFSTSNKAGTSRSEEKESSKNMYGESFGFKSVNPEERQGLVNSVFEGIAKK